MKSGNSAGKSSIFTLLRRVSSWKNRPGNYAFSGHLVPGKGNDERFPVAAGAESQIRTFSEAERGTLLLLARESLCCTVHKLERPPVGDLPRRLLEPRACFVTLTQHGKLRGCVGHVFPREALACAVADNARNAACCDPRFSPVTADELSGIRIEISVLSDMQALCFLSVDELLDDLRPHQDGVLLQVGSRLATFLPQVWDQFGSKTDFLDRLSEKAGCPPDTWRGPEARLSTYQIESFAETLDPSLRN